MGVGKDKGMGKQLFAFKKLIFLMYVNSLSMSICLDIDTNMDSMQDNTQDNTQDLVRVLIEENRVMRHELNMLKAQVIEMQAVQDCLSGTIVFDENIFLRKMSVRYLTMCDLDRNAIQKIIGICEKLDYPCMKYLIKITIGCTLYTGTYYNCESNSYKRLFEILHSRGCWNMLLDILKNFCEDRDMENAVCLASLLIVDCTDNTNSVLDICIKYDFDFEYKTARARPFIHLVSERCSMHAIKRIIDFYVWKKLDLDHVSNTGRTLSDALMSNRSHPTMLKYLNSTEKEVFV